MEEAAVELHIGTRNVFLTDDGAVNPTLGQILLESILESLALNFDMLLTVYLKPDHDEATRGGRKAVSLVDVRMRAVEKLGEAKRQLTIEAGIGSAAAGNPRAFEATPQLASMSLLDRLSSVGSIVIARGQMYLIGLYEQKRLQIVRLLLSVHTTMCGPNSC